MNDKPTLFVISDLHIQSAEDSIYRALLNFLERRIGAGDTLVLAGDVFDLFVGAKRVFLERYRDLFSALKAAGERGARMHYIEGNHDFLIQRAYRAIPGVTIHGSEVSLELSGRRFLITHGDLADSSDYGYRFLRAFLRSPLMKVFVTLAPSALIDWIGTRSSGYSRSQKPILPADLPIERRERLRNVYRSYAAEKIANGFDFVVMGHCHDLDEMSFTVGGRLGQYINVGFPRVHGSYLSWAPGDEKIQREALP